MGKIEVWSWMDCIRFLPEGVSEYGNRGEPAGVGMEVLVLAGFFADKNVSIDKIFVEV